MNIPFNPITQKQYSGNNIERLLDVARNSGYDSCQFATFKQWISMGRIVIKGQKAASKIFYVSESEGNEKRGRAYSVFAFEQTELMKKE